MSWAKDSEVSAEIWNFINQNRNHLDHTDDFEPNKVYPSRRSWERLDQCLTQADLLQEASPVLYNLTSAFVGFEAAVAFNDFVLNYDRQVTTDDILVHGNFAKVADFGINDHTAIIDKFEAEETFHNELDQELVNNLARYFVMLPSEVAMKLWTVMGKGDVNNTVKLHKSEVDGESVSKHFVRLINGSEEDVK